MLVSHVRVLPAMETLMSAPDNRVQAFLAAGHVCTITGYQPYTPFAQKHSVPVAITGFEPIDLLRGIHEVVRQLESGRNEVINCYSRSVREEGNLAAIKAINEVYEIADQSWRGFGVVADGGLRLCEPYRHFDARRRFAAAEFLPVIDRSGCRSGDVLAGRIKPIDCEHFAGNCHPDHPLGAPMVSSEGACAAYHRYQLQREPTIR
jgi:hydrogenase expression/formation protein HypD